MTIRYETRDEVGVFTIDNGKLNLVTVEMHKQICLCLYDFLYDDGIKVGVMIGAGNRCFSAGDDLKEDTLPIHAKPDWRQMSSLTGRIARHPLIGIRTEMEAYYRGLDLSKNDALSLTRRLYQYQRELTLVQKGDTQEYTFKNMEPLIKETGDQ